MRQANSIEYSQKFKESLKTGIMNKVADTIVSFLMNPQAAKKQGSSKQPEMPKSSYAMSKIDGEVYDSAELDCIYKCMYEMCINDVKI